MLSAHHPEWQQRRFRTFLESFNIPLVNTWRRDGAEGGTATAWTYESDSNGGRTQIDSVGVTEGILAEGWLAEKMANKGWRKFDHRVVGASAQVLVTEVEAGAELGGEGNAKEECVTFKGWEAANEEGREEFGGKALALIQKQNLGVRCCLLC